MRDARRSPTECCGRGDVWPQRPRRLPRHSKDDRRAELTKLTIRDAGRYVRVTIQAGQVTKSAPEVRPQAPQIRDGKGQRLL